MGRQVQSFEELFGDVAPRRSSRASEAEMIEDTGSDHHSIPRVDRSVPQLTLYTRITLGGEAPAAAITGIFVPQAFRPSDKIDAIIFLHGHHSSTAYPPEINISNHWNGTRYPLFRLREELNRTGRSFVLIAPTLGPKSQAGWLTNRNGLDRFLDHVRAELLAASIGLPSDAKWGNLVLSCHSGGGAVMRGIVSTINELNKNITQCWGFDSLYGDCDVPTWLEWGSRSGKRVYIHYGAGTPRRSQFLLEKVRERFADSASSIFVDGDTAVSHNAVPITHWYNRIMALP
jgi:hypothetical protein